MIRHTVFFMACLAACGGGGPTNTTGDPPVNTDPGNEPGTPPAANVEQLGTLHVAVNPALEGAAPVELRFDGAMMLGTEIVPGTELAVEVEAGTHTVGLVCPDFCWATANGNWTSQGQSCGEWELDVTVPVNDTARLEATLCRDLTGRWTLEGSADPPRDVYVISANGRCTTRNMPLFNFEVLGDQVRPEEGNGAWVTVLDNGNRIEYEGVVVVRRTK